MIRLVFCDVDGTLVAPWSDEVSERVRQAVRAVDASGIIVGYATGRTIESLHLVMDQIGLKRAWGVCSNGAVLARFDESLPGGCEVIREKPIEPAEAVRRLLAAVPDAIVASLQGGMYLTTRPFPPDELFAERVAPYEEVVGRPTTKAVMRWPDRTGDEVQGLIAGVELPDGIDAVMSKERAWLDLLPWGVSKAATAAEVTELLGVDPSEVMAIGDDYNDIDLVAWAGHGVAMGGSPGPLLAVADAQTAGVEDDGAALVLEELVRNQH